MKKSVKRIFVILLIILTGFLFYLVSYAEVFKTGVVNSFNLHLREAPNTSSEVLRDMPEGAKLTVTGTSNGWYKVTYKGTTGWAASKFITLINSGSQQSTAGSKTNTIVKNEAVGKGIITGNDVRLRSGPGTSYRIIGMLYKGNGIGLIARSGIWFRVKTSGGTVGWVSQDFIKIDKGVVSRGIRETIPEVISPKEETQATSSARTRLIEYAKKFLGVRYVYGGTTPRGFDCSGFVKYVFSNFGIKLERVASDQSRQGRPVSWSELRPGDLLFFDTDGGHSNVSHVGIYLGGGKFIHASSNRLRHRVTINDLSGTYSRLYLRARNVLD